MPSAFGRKGAPGIVTAFKPFSPKQMQALTWWCPGSPHSGKSGIICDGAVRSGKTLCMSLSFVSWAFYRFRDTAFALCGKTVASLRRNVLTPLTEQLTALGFTCTFKISRSELTVRRDGRENRFYLFGGRDESSAALIQGMTLGGVLLDEVALMPRSFVEQALARCSLEGATYWFNCNPDPKSGGKAGVVPALSDDGQSLSIPGGAAAVQATVQRHLLPPVRRGALGGGRRTGVPHV